MKTGDVLMLPELSNDVYPSKTPPLDVDELHTKITALMKLLSEGCSEAGTYWVYKRDGDPTVSVVNLEKSELYQNMPKEDQLQYLIRFKALRMEECHNYISIINQSPYSDSHNTTQQFLIIQAITILHVQQFERFDYYRI